MNKEELKNKLLTLGINQNRFSLEGELKLDSIVLFASNNKYIVSYVDEKGMVDQLKTFALQDEACLFIYKLFLDAREIEIKFNINTLE